MNSPTGVAAKDELQLITKALSEASAICDNEMLDCGGISNQRDHDRDDDGVPNRFDRLPDRPYRR